MGGFLCGEGTNLNRKKKKTRHREYINHRDQIDSRGKKLISYCLYATVQQQCTVLRIYVSVFVSFSLFQAILNYLKYISWLIIHSPSKICFSSFLEEEKLQMQFLKSMDTSLPNLSNLYLGICKSLGRCVKWSWLPVLFLMINQNKDISPTMWLEQVRE